ncbi:SDR family oxidoreductase [Sinirhodobacter populi]|uniref:SDR family oxidoreductase n=1 Tax=Paenirhodobacter populi TaxID=2306993 RepID=A0A443K0D6_9RHOB|nr:SDR family NAD(P)-dependent oxidoreductase [Sinirhodobacter populi]RWR26175.1 SDR family oxidoreductase [Sinirhodobacter populi]
MNALEGMTALVTGASSGIGRAIALRLAQDGARVIGADITEQVVEGGPPLAEPLREISPESRFARLDVRDHEATSALINDIAAREGRLDLVVTSAMVPGGKALPETDMAEWLRVTSVNLTGVYVTLHAALAQMLTQAPRGTENERGRIVNIGSQHGIIASPGSFAYGVSKAAVLQMTRQIAADHAQDGIVCNSVSPGKILTGKTGPAVSETALAYSNARTPAPRLGRPSDVAAAVAYLASPQTTFINGHNLLVDGGWMAA